MVPFVRINLNGSQTLLTYDDVIDMLSQVGLLGFIQSFKVFNIEVSREFMQNFNGTKAKVGDIQLQFDEEFIAQATCLPQLGEKWFKKMKVKNIPWKSLLESKRLQYHIKVVPIEFFHRKCNSLLSLIKQLFTYERLYGLVFYYLIRLIMTFQGFHLNLPFCLHRILQKMSKFYQRLSQNLETGLFHHGLIRTLVEYHLTNTGDN